MFHERVILAPSTCPRVVEHDGDLYACGLADWDHDGECVWFVPGGYLPPPLITPLDWLDAGWKGPWSPGWRWQCPICRTPGDTAYSEPTLAIYGDAEDAERNEIRWEFRPCGCEGREFAGDDATPGSD